MTQQQIQTAAQELVDLTIKFKKLEDEIVQLKLSIYDEAKGGIVCNGGKINFVKEFDGSRLNQELLSGNLKKHFGLTDTQIQNLIDSSQKKVHRDPSIVVYLDK